MSSPDRRPDAPAGLRAVARDAIVHGLREHRPPRVEPMRYPPELREPRASFVTLRRCGELRGCTGNLEPDGPLVVGVARNAYRSAFSDPRFPPLREDELDGLEISVCVLSSLEPLEVASEVELLAKLRPGVDGLVLRDGVRGATFLPSVWEGLPTRRAFLDALWRKADLAPGHWSPALRFERYTTETVD